METVWDHGGASMGMILGVLHAALVGMAVGLTPQWHPLVPERIADPEVHALMQRIGVRATEPMDRLWPDAYPFRLTLTTKSGATLVREIHYAKGHPKNPMDDAEIEAKFHKLADGVLGGEAVDRALKVLWKFPELRNVSEVFEPFVLVGSR
jgi:2-methylcitrate dehydratase